MKRNNMRFNKSRQQRFGNNGQGGGGYRRNNNRPNGQGGQAGVPDKRNLRRYQDLRDNYNNKARDALAGGDRVTAEYFYQHADHYFRMAKEIEDYLAQFEPVRHEHSANGEAPAGEFDQAAAGDAEQLPMPDTQEQAAPEDRDNLQ